MEGSLPRSADRAFQQAEQGEARILLPDIVIGEFVYTALKGRLQTSDPIALIQEMLEQIETSAFFDSSRHDSRSLESVSSKSREGAS